MMLAAMRLGGRDRRERCRGRNEDRTGAGRVTEMRGKRERKEKEK